MPLPMVHLSVALKCLNNDEVNPSFLLGSIAPDAIHMRKGATRADKNRTHFFENHPVHLDSLETEYRNYIRLQQNEEWQWFVRGYFVHILTDGYWWSTVFRSYEQSIKQANLSPEQKRETYYQETDQIDFNLYWASEWKNAVWNTLMHTEAQGLPPLLTADEVNYWRWRTIHWFDLLSREPKVEPTYITQGMVDQFIEDASVHINEVIKRWDEVL